MVHPSVLPDSLERMRHERFLMTRLLVGGGALGLIPAYLAWRGTIGPVEIAIMIAAVLPLLAMVLLSRTGRLDVAHSVSAAALALFVCSLAAVTGGASSPLLLWLAAVPVEGMFFGTRMHVMRAGAIAAVALTCLIALDLVGLLPPGENWLSGPMLVSAAILNAMLIAAGFLRRRRLELREHRASDARARLLLDHVGELVTWHDETGAVIYANAAAAHLTGSAPRLLHGRGLLDRVHVADRPLFLKTLNEAMHGAGNAGACFRTLFVPDAGGPPVSLWLEMKAHRVPVRERQGGVAIVAVMRDVTQRVAQEEERARGHAEAVKASDVKDRFLATVSHELRTPLNAIIGFSEMLATDTQGFIDAARREEYARIIHSSGHHLLDVVNTLLDISKIESGAMTIDPEPVDLAEMARDCSKLVALRASEGRLTLERVVGPGLPELSCDRRAMKQVMLNLLSNAVKFTPAGGRVTLAIVRDGDMIDLSVADTGIGIAAEDLPRLGDPFFQAKGSYERAYEGTGLGLSVVRGLVGLHGGKLTVESAQGAGTRVCVRLPLSGPARASEPVQISTYARAPRRGLEHKEPIRLSA